MRLQLLVTILLLKWSLVSNAHSLEPSRLAIYTINDYTQFSVFAVNRYDFAATFVVEVFADESLAVPVEFEGVKTFKLPQQGRRRVLIQMHSPPELFYVCTRTQGSQGGQMTFATRVCSKVTVYE